MISRNFISRILLQSFFRDLFRLIQASWWKTSAPVLDPWPWLPYSLKRDKTQSTPFDRQKADMLFLDSTFDHLNPKTVAVIGIPFDENSSFMRGPASAPPRIREALHSGSANLCAENGIDLESRKDWVDLGDLPLSLGPEAFKTIESMIGRLLDKDIRVMSLGGDHSITYPIVRAYSRKFPGLTVLHFDAHPDLYDAWDGNRFSHACPFSRIMEERLVGRLIQVGVRTMNPHQRKQAERFGVEVIEMRQARSGKNFKIDGPLYLSLDMDVLDPAFAPGVSHHEPGGLSTRELLTIVQDLKKPPVGADIVEFNPERDPLGITAMVAAKLYKEIVAFMIG
jgi:arginase